MKKIRIGAAVLLAIPLIVFGLNYFLQFIKPPHEDSVGFDVITKMGEGGLMLYMALSHIIIGVMLLIPKTRFVAGLLQLTLSIGILFFHVTLMPTGIGIAIIMLVLNIIVIADRDKLTSLLA